MKNISIRVNEDKLGLLDKIAKIEGEDRSYIINKLIDERIESYHWQLEKIEEGLKDLENKNFANNNHKLIKKIIK